MDLKNNYWWFGSALSPDQCDRLIELGEAKIQKAKGQGKSTIATTAEPLHKGANPNSIPRNDLSVEEAKKVLNVNDLEKETYIRDSEVGWIEDQWVYDLICPYIYKANKLAGWDWDIDWHETFQFTKYDKNGFYGWHTDGGSDTQSAYKRFIPGISPQTENGDPKYGWTRTPQMIGKVRKISATINISPENSYSGGNLKFDFGPHVTNERFHECAEIRPRGSIIVFPSFMKHQVTPVTEGTRYSLVLWSLGKPFR
jgi:PKHD-type hydroxylase